MKRIPTNKASAIALVVALAALPSLAHAKEAEASIDEQQENAAITNRSVEDSDTGLGDIVVTAQKRSESLQRVPAAITAIGADDLKARGVTDLREMRGLVPSAIFSPAFIVTKIFVRGVGKDPDGEFNDPAVAMNIDGVYVSRYISGTSLFDVERIEVLPGPQGTLYGRNAAGGAINVATKLPGKEFGGEGSLEYGNYGQIHGFSAVNLPVSSNLSVRAAFDANHRDGITTNGLNGIDTYAARLVARYESDAGHSLVVRGEYQHKGGGGDSVVLRPLLSPGNPWFQSKIPGENFYTDRDAYRLNAELNLNLGGSQNVTLTYIPGFNQYIQTYRLQQGHPVAYYPDPGVTGTPLTGFAGAFEQLGSKGDQYTHELRISGNNDQMNWVVGLYYFRHLARGPGGSFEIYNPAVFSGGSFQPYALRTGGNASTFRVTTQSKAVFGQFTFSASDSLRLTGGLRYSSDDRHAAGIAQSSNPIANIIRPPLVYDLRQSDDRIDWKVGVEADIGPHSLAYAGVQTGYIGGGFNVSATIQTAQQFTPENLTSYTVGLKNTFANGSIKLNFEGFYYDYRKLQVGAINALTGTSILQNVPKSEIYGLQVDAAYRASPNTTISANLGYLHATVREGILGPQASYTCAVGSPVPAEYCSRTSLINYAGRRLPYAPSWSGSMSVTQRFDMASGGNLEAIVSANFQSRVFYSLTNQLGTDVGGYVKADASLTYHSPDDKWSIGLWGKNLTNIATYSSMGFTSAYGLQTWVIAPPRTYGARISFEF